VNLGLDDSESLIHATGRSARTIFELRGTRSGSENGPDSYVGALSGRKTGIHFCGKRAGASTSNDQALGLKRGLFPRPRRKRANFTFRRPPSAAFVATRYSRS
jgi:hypothetical protein